MICCLHIFCSWAAALISVFNIFTKLDSSLFPVTWTGWKSCYTIFLFFFFFLQDSASVSRSGSLLLFFFLLILQKITCSFVICHLFSLISCDFIAHTWNTWKALLLLLPLTSLTGVLLIPWFLCFCFRVHNTSILYELLHQEGKVLFICKMRLYIFFGINVLFLFSNMPDECVNTQTHWKYLLTHDDRTVRHCHWVVFLFILCCLVEKILDRRCSYEVH